ncbi:MAG: GNAT family N-acetyltransferase [Ramlibacter sp.]|nr:GNAT family N-acetyltransferase [Ramlibacter sp.]
MTPGLRIQQVDHRSPEVAAQIHAVQMAAYAQEAELLGAVFFPPIHRTVGDIRALDEVFLAAFASDALTGAVSVWPDPEGMGTNIASLVVSPQSQRRGIGASLMESVVAAHASGDITVQTGARNFPALSLYSQFGFVEIRRWFVGREPLELVKLLRVPRDRPSS